MKATLILILCIAVVSSEGYPVEEGVLVLTATSFPQAIAQYENLFVEFYAPWDGHCQIFAKEYAKTAQELAESDLDVKLAKIDFTVEETLAQKYEIRNYPTLILFSRSFNYLPIFYKGPRTSFDIISWLKKKTSPGSVEVNTIEETQALVENSESLAIFFGPSGTEAFHNFLKVSVGSEDVTFAHNQNQTVADKFNVPFNTILLFRKFDQEKSIHTGAMSMEDMKVFIHENKNPPFFQFTERALEKFFGEGLDILILIRDDDENGQKAEEALKEISQEVKGKLVSSAININDSLGKRFIEQIGIDKEQHPTIILIRASKNNLKYLFEGEINIENLRSFIQDFSNNRLKPLLKSAPIPDQAYEDGVMVVVGKNFDKVVLDDNTDVLVEYYASWNGHCKSFAPLYSALAMKFKNVQGLTIAKMDIAANEVEGLDVDRFPKIRFYPKGKKHQFNDYHGKLTVEDLSSYLREHSTSVQQFNEFVLDNLNLL